MTKLIATYTEGFVACFTEGRTGMRQRALIDIGDAQAPTPQELAEMAGSFADRWGWMNAIERSPASVKKGELTAPRAPRKARDDSSDPKPEVRITMTQEYLATHPGSTLREIVAGLGLEPDQYRLGRWSHTMTLLLKMGLITSALETIKVPGSSAPVNQKRYTLTQGAKS